MIESRVRTTSILVNAINSSTNPPKVFVSTSGKCVYGTHENEKITENSHTGVFNDMPAKLSEVWEAAAR